MKKSISEISASEIRYPRLQGAIRVRMGTVLWERLGPQPTLPIKNAVVASEAPSK